MSNKKKKLKAEKREDQKHAAKKKSQHGGTLAGQISRAKTSRKYGRKTKKKISC